MSVIYNNTPYGVVALGISEGKAQWIMEAVSEKEARECMEGGEDDDPCVPMERHS